MKLGDLFIKLGLQKDGFDKGINDAKQQTSSFGNAMKKIGGMIAGMFAVDRIIQFGREVFQVATQAEGVQAAFNKIANSRDLDNLRTSVRGTVSDLELMKRSVMASNFGIPVQELGRLFEFASKRAQDTGQSVDYLVDSIVTGIGRKSPLILDNLGISAVALKQKLNGVGLETASVADITRAVGDIAEESFSKTGRLADNLGTKVQSLSANWENLKLTLSSLFSNSEMIKNDLDDWSKLLQIWQSKELTKWEKFISSFSGVQANKVFAKMQNLQSFGGLNPESEGGPLEKTKEDQKDVTKSAVEQLAAMRKITEELEAQRILRQEFKGEKMTPITGIGLGTGDTMLSQESVDMQGVFGNMDSHYKTISENREKWTKEELQGWTDFTTELNQSIASGIGDVIGTMAEGFGEMMATGNWDWGEFGLGILDTIGKFMQQLGGLLIAFGIAHSKWFIALTTAATNPLSGGLAIAAGAGLIAAGAAVSSFASKGPGGNAASTPASGYSNYSQSNAGVMLAGNVVFELEGTKLKGVLNNTDRKNNLIR